MRIVLLTNAASGKGGSHSLAAQSADALARAGHTVDRVALGPGWQSEINDSRPDLIVACGGDGTVSAAAPLASERDIPIYHLPRGTENLFAREFSMRPDAARLRDAVGAWRVERFDLAECRVDDALPRCFVLMCSVGFDADVLHALAARRSGPISHGSYTIPVIASLMRPTIRTLTIEVDGRVVVEGVKGNAVVSNCGRYALGIDPSRDASMTDGMLDVFFAPSASSARTLAWMGMALARLGHNARSIVRARGRIVRIHAAPARRTTGPATHRHQLDGEAIGPDGSGGTLTLGVRPRALPVLLPAPD